MEDKKRNWISLCDEEQGEEEEDVRKGPWTEEEDQLLADYVSVHGDRRWNHVARFSGLKRTGKSCRLRWLNYLRPNVRHGNLTLQEQYSILKFHSLWGNRWSKIAQQLPGRTDNEIKNYFRTRVRKQAKQLNCEVESKPFKEIMRHVLMPRLEEQIRIHYSSSASSTCQHMDSQFSPTEPVPDHRRPSDVSGIEYNSPGELSSIWLSTVSDPLNGYGQSDDLGTRSGLYPDNSGFEDFNDFWGSGTDNLWGEDNFQF